MGDTVQIHVSGKKRNFSIAQEKCCQRCIRKSFSMVKSFMHLGFSFFNPKLCKKSMTLVFCLSKIMKASSLFLGKISFFVFLEATFLPSQTQLKRQRPKGQMLKPRASVKQAQNADKKHKAASFSQPKFSSSPTLKEVPPSRWHQIKNFLPRELGMLSSMGVSACLHRENGIYDVGQWICLSCLPFFALGFERKLWHRERISRVFSVS